MKRLLSAVLVLLCIISLLPFSANAQEMFPEWDFSSDTHVLSASSGNTVYRHTATKDETIAFEVPYGKASIYLTYHNAGGEDGHTPRNIQFMKNDTILYILEFQTGYEYNLNFSLASDQKEITVKTFSWNDSMYPVVQPGQTKSVTISPEKSISFIATVPTSGLYTVSMGHKDFHANVSSYPDISTHEYPSPVSLGYCQENEKYQYCYYMEAGVKYHLEIFYYGETDLTGNFTFKQGGPNDDYGIWKEGETKTLTIEPHDNNNMKYKTFVFKAEHDGKHYIFSKTFSGSIRGADGSIPEGTTFQDANLDQGWVHLLKKGQYYVITVHNYTDTLKTDSISLSHYTDYKSGELKILSHSEDMISVGLFTDPVCAAYDGITWSCSDPSLFEMKEFGALLELYPKKTGSAQITAKVGSLTKTITVSTTYTPPILQEGKTEFIPKASRYDPCAFFTPTVSGTYTLNFLPHTTGSGFRYSIEIYDSSDRRVYDNVGFESWTDIELDLEAGQKYTICVDGSASELRFDLRSAAATPTDPTNPEDSHPNDDPTEPSIGATEPPVGPGQDNPQPPADDPTEGTTEPSVDATVPSQGSNDPADKPKDPTQGNDAPSTPTGGNNVVTDAVTKEDVQEAIDEALKTDQTLHYTVSQEGDRTFQMEMDALNTVVDNGMALSANFICGTTVSLPADVLNQLGKNSQDGQVQLKVEPKAFSALNIQQTKAIEGLVHGKLLSIDLSVADQQIHQLGGTAQITISNPDPGKDWRVLYLAEDGSTEEMKVSCSDSTITFCTDHFSYFVLVHDMPTQSGDVGNGFGGAWLTILGILLLLGGAGAVVIVLHKKGILPFPAKK